MPAQRKYFGTDGVRSRAGKPPMTPETVLKLGWAAAGVLKQGDRPEILIGKDTRVSGYMFESALEAGVSAAGVNVGLLGPLPTPAIAFLTGAPDVVAGIVISASHNPYYDNGIKLFSSRATKLSDDEEIEIERWMAKSLTTVDGAALGKARRINDAAERYVEFCLGTLPPEIRLDGIKLVVDCAHGAAYQVAPQVYRALGADVVAIGVEPDGFNINRDCGVMHPQALQRKVSETCADLGIAMDGDGDRVLMVDGGGRLVDGDELLFVIADYHRRNGGMHGVVGTQMSNLGLETALRERGIPFERTPVGDRYVLQMLEKKNWFLGGETSGHIVCLDRTTTGDAIIASLAVLQALIADGACLADAVRPVEKHPQTLVNVPLARDSNGGGSRLAQAVAAAQVALGGRGRVLVRPSGTEPLLRVMVESESEDNSRRWAERIAEAAVERIAEATNTPSD